MKRTDWTVGEYSARPASNPNECFYCHAKMGEQHKEGCVIRKRTINVDFTVHMVISVPEDWEEGQINWHYNHGAWCASNLLNMLAHREDSDMCLCNITEAKYIGEATEEDEERYGCCRVDELES